MATWGEVVATERLTPTIVRVVLGGVGLEAFEPQPYTDQYVNALFIPEGAPYGVPFDPEAVRQLPPEQRPRGRRYTVRAWDAERRRLTIDFVVHGDLGYAGRWANRAAPGDRLQFTGPSGAYLPAPDADWHLMVGDESALPAIAASAEQVPPGRPVVVVAVIDAPGHEITLDSPGDLRVEWVYRSTDPGDPGDPRLLLAAVEALAFPAGRVDAFVHGEAAEVRAVRRHLFGARGVPKEGTSISPYWRRGQTDESWRQVKSAWLAESEADA